MGKTKPIGVRFDEVELEYVKKNEKLKSPQFVVNFLLHDYYIRNSVDEPVILTKSTKKTEKTADNNQEPVWEKEKKESWIDYRIRHNEWLESQKA